MRERWRMLRTRERSLERKDLSIAVAASLHFEMDGLCQECVWNDPIVKLSSNRCCTLRESSVVLCVKIIGRVSMRKRKGNGSPTFQYPPSGQGSHPQQTEHNKDSPGLEGYTPNPEASGALKLQRAWTATVQESRPCLFKIRGCDETKSPRVITNHDPFL